uniref:stabilin-2-like isoform X1 n=1 Tax=Styela clava TaxID=7725 RepID=UPI00193A963B|nr:stabilin-2-like isoform X1 [Styela clava]
MFLAFRNKMTKSMKSFGISVTLELTFIIFLFILSYTESTISENRCDTTTTQIFKTSCVNCWQNRKVGCPGSSKKLSRGTGARGCKYEVQVGEKTMPARGCTHTCQQTVTVGKCCAGYWGQDCQGCPKDNNGVICSGKGVCSDGISGNGTCSCQGNLIGSVCEKCNQPQFYGSTCQSTCSCVHGTCDNGVAGSGACFCADGYGGKLCDKVLTTCSSLNCHSNAACLNTTGVVKCHCNKGYTGDGSTCVDIDLCSTGNSLCHANATCLHTGPGQVSCECKEGFSGDGTWCSPIDPCQTNNGGCQSNSTVCKYDGPAKSHCECRYGFSDYTPDFGCSLVDVCGRYPKTTCDPMASCETVVVRNEITVKCTCPKGFRERFRVCYGDILSELEKLNESGKYQNKLNNAIDKISDYFHLMDMPATMTIFVPIDDAFPADNISSAYNLESHIVAGEFHLNFTQDSAKTMYPVIGYNYPIKCLRPGEVPDSDEDDDDAGYFADINVAGKVYGKILVDARPATNGLLYIIDTILNPPDVKSFMTNDTVLITLEKMDSMFAFTKLIKKSFSFQKKLTEGSYMLFAPTNEAMNKSFGQDELRYLMSQNGRPSLDMLLQNHMYEYPSQIHVFQLILQEISGVAVNVSEEDGSITVGNEGAKILKSDISMGCPSCNMYIIDKVLIPDIIQPLVKNRCNKTEVKKVRGPCGDCTKILCPPGGVALPIEESAILTCIYNAESQTEDGSLQLSHRIGCNRLCNVNKTSITCCQGFYGAECRPCSGPVFNACNTNGLCADGETGTGRCTCNTKFTGSQCDKCSNATKYGKTCQSDCLCRHGNCSNVIDSHGECVPGSCKEGWSGENCDRKIIKCGNGSLTCHQFASCVVGDNGTESCFCDPGYTGPGDDCIEYNPCESLENSACDPNSYCLHVGAGMTACECLPNYSGDGRTCFPVDPCAAMDHGGCSDFAQCNFAGPGQRTCECIKGFRGDGFVCTEINVCLENNGGCDQRAKCIKSGPGVRTCKCYDGYEGDGLTCLGNLLQEIAVHPDLSNLQRFITQWTSIRRLFMNLNSDSTCFLPSNSAWLSLSDDEKAFWITEQHLPFLLKNHIIKRELQTNSLTDLIGQSLPTLLDSVRMSINKVTVGSVDTNVGANVTEESNLPTIGKSYAKLLVSNIPVSNKRLIHIIDSVLLPPRDVVQDYLTLSAISSNTTGTHLEQYTKFLGLLVSTGIIDQIEETLSHYTVFVAPDSSTNFPLKNATPSNVADIIRYHVIPSKLIRINDINSGEHENSLLGSGYKITLVKRHGVILVNGQSVSVTGIRTSTGIIHGLSRKLLTAVKTRCDGSSFHNTQTICLPCSYPNRCPVNAMLISTSHCMYHHKTGSGAIKGSVGCQMNCVEPIRIPKCCDGFFGDGCDPCPGGIGNICFGRGKCWDSMKGNGSCTCSDSKHSGLACETCAGGRFGRNCDQECKCVNGICNDGINGDGSCTCELDFRGQFCDQEANKNNTCNNTCHSAANCVPLLVGSGTKCECIAGYEGDGTNCNVINPCKDPKIETGCHQSAFCQLVKPGIHQCICKENYEGDGTYCRPVNPCLYGFALTCDDNAICLQIGANMSNCVCNEGYEGDGKSCSPLDLCKKDNGGCSENAVCKTTGPGIRSCTCKIDYVGNGINCTGTIFSYISGRPEFEWFTLMDSFASLVPHTLNSDGPLNVFLPTQDDMMRLPSNWLSYEESATQIYLNHITGCVINLTEVTQLRTFAGDILDISQTDSGLMINGNISVLGDPIKFWNGNLYKISSPLVPKSVSRVTNTNDTLRKMPQFLQPYIQNTSDTENPLYKNTKLLLDSGFKWVATLLQTSGDLPLLQNPIHNPLTLFLPTNDAFENMPAQRLRSFISDQTYAREYIRYHIVRESFHTPTDVNLKEKLKTMQGSDLRLSCGTGNSPSGSIVINEGAATVIGFDVFFIKTSDGQETKAAVYIIDKVLDPPSIGGRCDVVENVTITTDCKLCISSREALCPEGTQLIEKTECRVPVFSTSKVTVTGCHLSCASYNVTYNCCVNHYGTNCHACPGGALNPCSGNGECDDGQTGDGTCTCKEGFIGYACENCHTGRYGINCLPCQCTVHGSCAEGINGDGTCFCDSNWTGPKCDQKRTDDTICNPPCHTNGYCVKSGTCLCKPGYRGDGTDSCVFMDMCSSDNGGCSPYAICSIVRDKVVCKCLPNFIGDGYVCEGYDPCQTSTGGCHPQARCMYVSANVSRCQCNTGYQGDGIRTCSRKVAKICASNNGDCSPHATCLDLPSTSPTEPSSTKCSCKTGYVGDGFVCHGTVLDVISESVDMREFYRQLRRIPPRVRRKLDSTTSNLTMFVPADMEGRRRFRPLPNFALTRHYVQGTQYYYKDLQNMNTIIMESGDILPIVKNAENHIFINGVRVKRYDILATNGVVHLVDSFITKKIITMTTKPAIVTQTPKSTTSTKKPSSQGPPKSTTNKLPPPGVITVKPGEPIDGWTPKPSLIYPETTSGINASVANNFQTKISTALTPTSKVSVTKGGYKRSQAIKVGVSVFIIFLIMVGVGVIYWWKNRHTFVFRPERQRLTSTSDPNDEDTFGGGLTNPAYDSTGFNAMNDDEDVILRTADDEMALALNKNEASMAFENPVSS